MYICIAASGEEIAQTDEDDDVLCFSLVLSLTLSLTHIHTHTGEGGGCSRAGQSVAEGVQRW